MKKILILGGCGYVGSMLTSNLLNQGFKIRVIDAQWFGKNLRNNKNLKIIKKDIRNLKSSDFKNIDVVIHLANIANDPAVDLNPTLSWEVNVLSTKIICDLAVKNKVKKIIYASSGSVYGVKKEKKVHESLDLVPISIYNKTKMVAERILLSYKNVIDIICVRPATVCGISPRMRLDVSVNMLTYQALENKLITVFGGRQFRPSIHIKDLTNLLKFFTIKKVPSGCYNAGFENISIMDIAKKIKYYIPCKIKVSKSNDMRSYRLDSSKLIKIGFKPKFGIEDAIKEIIFIYNKKKFRAKDLNYTVKSMLKSNIK
tara:strand:+ start:8344 stop:9285 length:942 start_codon:yes stop_codon:yes gene_type:complete